MRAEVIKPFYDIETGLGNVPGNTYKPGDVFEGDEQRIEGLVQKGFVKRAPVRSRKAAAKKNGE